MEAARSTPTVGSAMQATSDVAAQYVLHVRQLSSFNDDGDMIGDAVTGKW